jgi:hypothetical protein
VRSRIARVCTRVSGLVFGLIPALLITGATADRAEAETFEQVIAQDAPLESLGNPVALTAIGLGVAGMVAGVFRRKKTEVQPENQRKS